jgi:hypothetical protein
MREFRHRHNTRMAVKHRGWPQMFHYDCWIVDKLQMIHSKIYDQLFLPEYPCTFDFSNTKGDESFGIGPLNMCLEESCSKEANELFVDEDVVVVRKEFRFTESIAYLNSKMNTSIPYLHICHPDEVKIFNDLVLRRNSENDDFVEMAQEWNSKYADGKNVMNKLPCHLRSYMGTFRKRANFRASFQHMFLENMELRKTLRDNSPSLAADSEQKQPQPESNLNVSVPEAGATHFHSPHQDQMDTQTILDQPRVDVEEFIAQRSIGAVNSRECSEHSAAMTSLNDPPDSMTSLKDPQQMNVQSLTNQPQVNELSSVSASSTIQSSTQSFAVDSREQRRLDYVPHASMLYSCSSVPASHVEGECAVQPETAGKKRKKETEPRAKKRCVTGTKELICGSVDHSTKNCPHKEEPTRWLEPRVMIRRDKRIKLTASTG